MDHMIAHILDLALRTHRLCEAGSRAATQLSDLIRGLGYLVNDRGDLLGIDWDSWKEFVVEDIFRSEPNYLKGLLALGFGDNLLIGSYGPIPQDVEEKRSKDD